eukprot:6227663-Amphidinium_carterae.1
MMLAKVIGKLFLERSHDCPVWLARGCHSWTEHYLHMCQLCRLFRKAAAMWTGAVSMRHNQTRLRTLPEGVSGFASSHVPRIHSMGLEPGPWAHALTKWPWGQKIKKRS